MFRVYTVFIVYQPDCILVQTKELKMSPPDALRVFGSDAYDVVVSRGKWKLYSFISKYSFQIFLKLIY
jgi:hypothetical protein